MIFLGICGFDNYILKGLFSGNFFLILGYEGVGIVESIGGGVSLVKLGRKWGYKIK